MTETTLLKIEKNRYVAGLYWQPFYTKKDVKTLAKEVDAPFAITLESRASNKPGLVGFASKDCAKELSRQHYSIGSMFFTYARNTLNDPAAFNDANIVGVIELPEDQFLLVMISEGLIIREMIGNRDQIKQEYESALSILQQAVKFVSDASWSTEGRHVTLAQLIETATLKEHALKPLTVTLGQAIALLMMVALPFGAWVAFEHYQNMQRQTLIEQARQVQVQPVAAQKEKFIAPWANKPTPLQLWENCDVTLRGVQLHPSGWHYTALGCNEKGATVTWSRMGGLVENLLYHHPNAVIDLDGNRAVHNLSHQSIVQAADKTHDVKIDDLLGKHDAISYLNNQSQRYGFQLNISTSNNRQGLPGQPGQPTPEQIQPMSIEIQTHLLSVDVILALLPPSGLVIESFASSEPGKWIIKGVLYVR
ncbi:MAG: type 4b pilus protein PilO2 [Methyloprofundus sp.]|nr:type 4b pilus protein PilO2 [Methyloprofundus sp.]